MSEPYIGVTGFMSALEVEAVLSAVPTDKKYLLMVGVLASNKTLAGGPGKWPGRYPSAEKIRDIFVIAPKTLNLIHYATYDRVNLSAQLEELAAVGGPFLNGFQLNVCWPNPFDLEVIARRNLRIVLQIGAKALEQSSSSAGFREILGAYDGLDLFCYWRRFAQLTANCFERQFSRAVRFSPSRHCCRKIMHRDSLREKHRDEDEVNLPRVCQFRRGEK